MHEEISVDELIAHRSVLRTPRTVTRLRATQRATYT